MVPRDRFLLRVVAALTLVQLVVLSLSSAQLKTITILHTNDIHASFVPHEAFWIRDTPKPMVGGFRELEFIVDSIRKVKPATLLLDAGDVMTGNPITDMPYAGAEGGTLFEMMNRVGYDAWCIGNHDFDISQENLVGLTKIAKFPTLSANIVNDKSEFPVNNSPYAVIERGGLRIGIIGLMTQGLYNLVNQNNLVGIRVLSPVETARKLIDKLDAETDLLIAVTHQGVEDDSILAEGTTGLDVIVGGHSHTRLRKPRLINGVVIVQAGSNCENLGELELTVEDDQVTHYDGKLVQLWAGKDRPATPLSQFIDSIQGKIDEEYSEVIATLKQDWTRKDEESGIGNFITDAQREAAGAQVAFTNNRGIRRNVSAGPLTKRDLFEVLPFRNVLTTFQLSGKQLRDVVAYYIEGRAYIQTSGIACEWKQAPGGKQDIVSLKIGGKPIEDEKMYVCAASDYFVGEAKRYIGVEIETPVFLKQTMFDAVERAARTAKVISSHIEHRIKQVE